MRQIVLDTETTGLEYAQGHRIIEIGCVEMVNRRLTGERYHQYLHPDRDIDEAAMEVHGITLESLAEKPRFAEIADDLMNFLKGAELIIHNAPFDLGFLNNELSLLGGDWERIETYCAIVDTLGLARKLHPGQKNSLDALCRRYHIDNSQRSLHGALLDAEILADVYRAMTGGQGSLLLGGADEMAANGGAPIRRLAGDRLALPIICADEKELALHQQHLELIDRESGGRCVWKKLEDCN